ncbi:hypothetical protein JMJ35_010257 [Cladonia borealis]|uniref:C2H2-type domain-containing protein n=1 Tax=Cladonia borealis TaxID=184061 RepID=A0AA39QRQ9_9LECA|nr:hypothetical protein JMJ35_010257 [Cladonia borealis]
MEHDYISNELCDDRLLAEPPATPTRPSPSFSLPRGAREPIAVSTPTQSSIAVPQDRSDKSSQPTQPQERALFTLARFNPLKVIAWVEILQSLEPGYKHNGGLAPLSPLILNAVHELKGCEKDWVLAGLQVAARSRVTQPLSTPQTSALQTIASPRGYSPALQPAPSTPTRTSASSLHPSSAFSFRSVQSTHPSTLSNVTSSSQPSVIDQGSPASSKTSDHLHWCNKCEHPKAIESCDGYKRHMREHETIYHCMPDGPVKYTEAGQECYFCGAPDPEETHLATHAVSKCCGQYAKRQTYTRRVNLSNHIRDVHKTSEDHASALAQSWADFNKNKIKFFSCGFCICCFPTLAEKSNHIDMEHWRQHQELKEWNNNKVILGLLLQPGVKEEWHQRLMSAVIGPEFDPLFNPAPQWASSEVEHLQLQLEIGEDSAAALARLAFERSSYYLGCEANISDGTLQLYNQGVDLFDYPSIVQNTINTMQLPSHEFLQNSGNLSSIDDRLRASHGYRANSYHGDAPGFAQILPGHHRLPSTVGVYEGTATNYPQITGFRNHGNLFDLDPSRDMTSSMLDSETPFSSPWSMYTASQRPRSAQDPMFSEVQSSIQASFDPTLSAMHMDIASDRSTDQAEIDLPQHESTPMGNLTSSVDEATLVVPARRKSSRPTVIVGSKRKLSDSPRPESRGEGETNPVVMKTVRGYRDRHFNYHS